MTDTATDSGTEPSILDAGGLRPKWRTPTLSEDSLADITLFESNGPGSDGADMSGPQYINSGTLS